MESNGFKWNPMDVNVFTLQMGFLTQASIRSWYDFRYPSGHIFDSDFWKLIINMSVDLHWWSPNGMLSNVAIWKYSVDLWQAKNKQRSIRYCVAPLLGLLALYLAYRNLVDWPWTSSFWIHIYIILYCTQMFRMWHNRTFFETTFRGRPYLM